METFEICYERYDRLGWGMFLRSSTRGVDLFANRAFVGATGYRDSEFGSAFTAEFAWRVGRKEQTYSGVAVALCDDDVTAFIEAEYEDASVRVAGDFYVFSPVGRLDLGDLANGSVADEIIYLPRYPELGVAATTSREEVEWSVYDPAAIYLDTILQIAASFGIPCVEVTKTGVERESLEAMNAYLPRIAHEMEILGKTRE